ncbi:HAMP domain-containing sensor histidine kinase [Nocardioides sp. YIM 152588]|uniref:HAMP domain-containing sensor histidine kinase n=1 Tax=Nocardioides sp. YIM 152588 TaxID=3158259 RepID=UPI0032E37352
MTLRTRILTLTVGATTAVLLLFAIPLGLLERRAAEQDVEQDATDTAWAVADYLSAGGTGDLTAYVQRINDRDEGSPVAVVAPDGTRYGPTLPDAGTTSAPTYSPSASPPEREDGHDGGADDGDGDHDEPFLRQSGAQITAVDGGSLVRVDVRTAGGPTSVTAFAADDEVRHRVTERLLPLALAAGVLLLVVAATAEFVSRRLVRDLGRTADLADAIAAGDAMARVPESGPPEVRRVAHALNGLAGRIDELLAAERETAADLSHRLRTPLTALRLDVESLPEGPARSDLEDRVNTLERTLTAVIHDARRTVREGARVGCRPGPVVAASVDYWRPLVEDQDRRMEVDVAPDLPEVRCADEDLRAAIDALLENCIAHTPDGTAIGVRAYAAPDAPRVIVAVRDAGPGFDPRSVRRGLSDRGSSGLGLDIARRCARASGGELVVGREPGGTGSGAEEWTVVRLDLGLA